MGTKLGRRRILIVSVVVSLVLFSSSIGSANTESLGLWGPTTNYPAGTYGQSCAIYSGYMYCVGGSTGGGIADAVYYAQVSSSGVGTWALAVNSYPTAIEYQSCAISSGYIYCVGGWTGSAATDAVYYAAVSSTGVGKWTSTPNNYPANIEYQSCAISSGYIYCVGGWTGSTATNAVYYAQVSSSGVGPWALATHSYPSGIYGQSCATYSDYMYCVGGFNGSIVTDAVYFALVSSSGVGPWTLATNNYPTNVEDQSCAISSGYIYCVAGFNGDIIADAVYYATVSPSGVGPWSSTTVYPVDTYYLSCAISSSYVYCVGGSTGSAYANAVYYDLISAPPATTTTTATTTSTATSTTSATTTTTSTTESTTTSTTTATQTVTSSTTSTTTSPTTTTTTYSTTTTTTATTASPTTTTATQTVTSSTTSTTTSPTTTTTTSISPTTTTTTATTASPTTTTATQTVTSSTTTINATTTVATPTTTTTTTTEALTTTTATIRETESTTVTLAPTTSSTTEFPPATSYGTVTSTATSTVTVTSSITKATTLSRESTATVTSGTTSTATVTSLATTTTTTTTSATTGVEIAGIAIGAGIAIAGIAIALLLALRRRAADE